MKTRAKTDTLERAIYSEICSHDGIKAKDIGKKIAADRKTINQYLYKAPFIERALLSGPGFQMAWIDQTEPAAYWIGRFLRLLWDRSGISGIKRK